MPKFQLKDGPLLAAAFLPLGMGAVFFKRRLAQKRGLLVLTFALLSGAMFVAVGCGGGSKSVMAQPSTFMVNVTATAGAISHSTVVTLTVN
jgi:arginine exporter protein ArgO